MLEPQLQVHRVESVLRLNLDEVLMVFCLEALSDILAGFPRGDAHTLVSAGGVRLGIDVDLVCGERARA